MVRDVAGLALSMEIYLQWRVKVEEERYLRNGKRGSRGRA